MCISVLLAYMSMHYLCAWCPWKSRYWLPDSAPNLTSELFKLLTFIFILF